MPAGRAGSGLEGSWCSRGGRTQWRAQLGAQYSEKDKPTHHALQPTNLGNCQGQAVANRPRGWDPCHTSAQRTPGCVAQTAVGCLPQPHTAAGPPEGERGRISGNGEAGSTSLAFRKEPCTRSTCMHTCVHTCRHMSALTGAHAHTCSCAHSLLTRAHTDSHRSCAYTQVCVHTHVHTPACVSTRQRPVP